MTLFFYLGSTSAFSAGTALDTDVVRLGQIEGFSQIADQGQAAFTDLAMDDTAGALSLVGLRPFWVEETACNPSRVWSGYLTSRKYARDVTRTKLVGADRLTTPTLVDINAILDLRVIAFNDGNRPAETDLARVAWILGSTYLPVYDNGQIAASTSITMDAADYRGQYPHDVLNDCANASTRNYFVYWDSTAPAGQELSLYYHLLGFTTGFTSSLRLTNHAADVDDSVTFSATGSLTRDPQDVYSGVWMDYDGGHVWHTRASTATAFIARHAVAPANKTKSRTTAGKRAEKFLDAADTETDVIESRVQLPKTKVNLIDIGRAVDVKFDHLPGYSAGYVSLQVTGRQVNQSLENPDYYQVDLVLSNPKPSGGAGGGGSGGPFQPDCGADFSTNLLIGETIVAGFIDEAVYEPATPANVNDGVIGISAPVSSSPSGVDPDGSGTWTVDLGTPMTIAGFGLQVTACADHLFLDHSSDGTAWTNVAESDGDESGTPSYIHQYEFVSATFRYWRLRYTHTGGGFRCGADVAEWELYPGADCATPLVGQSIPAESGGTQVAGTVLFTTNYPYQPGSLKVYVNGTRVFNFTETDPTLGTFTFAVAPPAGSNVTWEYTAANDVTTGAANPDAGSGDVSVIPQRAARLYDWPAF